MQLAGRNGVIFPGYYRYLNSVECQSIFHIEAQISTDFQNHFKVFSKQRNVVASDKKKITPEGSRRFGGACRARNTSQFWEPVAGAGCNSTRLLTIPAQNEARRGFPFPLLLRVARLQESLLLAALRAVLTF